MAVKIHHFDKKKKSTKIKILIMITQKHFSVEGKNNVKVKAMLKFAENPCRS